MDTGIALVGTPRARASMGLLRGRHTPVAVALVVLVLYQMLCAATLRHESPVAFATLSASFLTQSHASPTITALAHGYQFLPNGYDGQFFLYIALDPTAAHAYIDNPSYRYARIGYPLAARLMALGQPHWIPYTLILLNWLAIGGGTLAVALWLKRRRVSPWFALAYGLCPGLLVSLQRDLSEPLAYGLVALGVYLGDYGGRRRLLWAGLSFACALLTRETTSLFILMYGVAVLGGRGVGEWRRGDPPRWRDAALILAVACLPYVAYKLFLRCWLGSSGVPAASLPDPIPFHGFLAWWPWNADQLECLRSGIVPAIICLAAALWTLRRHPTSTELWMLIINVLMLIVFLPTASYDGYGSIGRMMIGVALASVYCLPVVTHAATTGRSWFWCAAALWLAPLSYLLFAPIAAAF